MRVPWYFWPLLLVYRLVVLPILLSLFFTLGIWFSPKVRQGFRLRRESPLRQAPDWVGQIRPLWIHAASGEFEYAKALLRELKSRFPKTPVLVTYFSPTYQKNIAQTSEVDWHEPLPLDTPSACRQFLLRFKPLALLISRTDVWPEMIYQCHRARLPMILFSATFAEDKANRWLRGLLVRWLYPLLQEIHCVSKDDEIQLRRLLPKSAVTASGDTRYDQVLYRLSHRKVLKENLKPHQRLQTLVAGSTWPEDEAALLKVVAPFLKEKRLQMILAPHEPTPGHLRPLTDQLTKLGVPLRIYSEATEFNLGEVLIVDQVGILADLYSWGSMAFVGGSFRGSVHSVMEPLGSGAVTLVGPHHYNNREAMEFKHKSLNPQLHMVQTCRSSQDLGEALALLLQLGPSRAGWPELIIDQVLKKSGASIQLAQSLGSKFNLR
ncbi:MAG: hypothetical protein IT288_14860 [Bdellovibrionales bacterium]|nr:hypothetical protein [Bdellovibrionales bacterium]